MGARDRFERGHQWLLYFEERWLILPAARWAPLNVALSMAWVLAGGELLLPSGTRRFAAAEMRSATGRELGYFNRPTHRRLAARFYELVWLTRMRFGRERTKTWRIEECNRGDVEEMLRAGPVMVVTAHFSDAAMYAVERGLPRGFAYLASDPGVRPKGARERRARLTTEGRDLGRLGLLTPAFPESDLLIKVPGWDSPWDQPRDRAGSVREMVRRLKRNEAVLVRVDAEWEQGRGLVRQFAGLRSRTFALGAVRAARLAGCPVLPMVAHMDGWSRTVKVEWYPPIHVSKDVVQLDEDKRVLNEVLDHLETAIRRFPTRYLHVLGADRRWLSEPSA